MLIRSYVQINICVKSVLKVCTGPPNEVINERSAVIVRMCFMVRSSTNFFDGFRMEKYITSIPNIYYIYKLVNYFACEYIRYDTVIIRCFWWIRAENFEINIFHVSSSLQQYLQVSPSGITILNICYFHVFIYLFKNHQRSQFVRN